MHKSVDMSHVFATRTYELRAGGRVTLSIGSPTLQPNGDYQCHLQTEGLLYDLSLFSHGVDSIQALVGSIAIADAHLRSSGECIRGELTWLGSEYAGDVGLLEHPSRPDAT